MAGKGASKAHTEKDVADEQESNAAANADSQHETDQQSAETADLKSVKANGQEIGNSFTSSERAGDKGEGAGDVGDATGRGRNEKDGKKVDLDGLDMNAMREMVQLLSQQVSLLEKSNEELKGKLDTITISNKTSQWSEWWTRNSKISSKSLDDALSVFDGTSLLGVFDALNHQADQGFKELAGVKQRLETFYQKNVPTTSMMPDLRQFNLQELRKGVSAEFDRQHAALNATFGAELDLTKFLEMPLNPKKRQYLAVLMIFSILPASILLSLFTIFCCFYYNSRVGFAFVSVYLAFIATDKSHIENARPLKFLQTGRIWSYFRNYFPIELRKANPSTVFSPEKKYLFGYHPHGVISVGCWANFCTDFSSASKLFPGIQIHPATLNMNFVIPVFRDFLLSHGVISVSRKSIKHSLESPGHAPLVVVGGAAEALDAAPGTHDLTLRRRNGFFRLALESGANLVPVYSFGENDIFYAPDVQKYSWLRRLQSRALKLMGFSLPVYSGAGYLCLPAVPLSPIPRRKPIITVVGDPIECPKIANPTQADIDVVKEMYVGKLREIFEKFADEYAPDRKGGLKIVA